MQNFSRIFRLAFHALWQSGRWLWAALPWLLAGTLLGGAAGAALSLTEPRMAEATTIISLEPETFRPNIVAAIPGLIHNYALGLTSRPNLQRLRTAAGTAIDVATLQQWLRVEANGSNSTMTILMRAPTREEAVSLSQTLVEIFRSDLRAANLRQDPADRLRITVLRPPVEGAWITPRPRLMATRGAWLGLVAAFLLAGLRSWRRHTTFLRPLDVERILRAPTLGAIPPTRR